MDLNCKHLMILGKMKSFKKYPNHRFRKRPVHFTVFLIPITRKPACKILHFTLYYLQ